MLEAQIKAGSGEPNKVKVGTVTQEQLKVRTARFSSL